MSWILLDYMCTDCNSVVESLEGRADVAATKPCECGGTRYRCLSPVSYKPKYGTVVTGESDEAPPWAMDTCPPEYK